MRMDTEDLGPRLIKITLAGRLDTPGVDSIETRFLATLVPNGNSAVIDMSQVDFISSMGIRMLVSAARSLKVRQASLSLFGVQEQVSQILELVSIGQMIHVCASEAEAQSAVRSSVA